MVTDDDVFHAAEGMQSHIDLLEGKVEEKRDPSFKEMLKNASLESFAEVLDIVNSVACDVNVVNTKVSNVASEVQQLGGGRSSLIREIALLLGETIDKIKYVVGTTRR